MRIPPPAPSAVLQEPVVVPVAAFLRQGLPSVSESFCPSHSLPVEGVAAGGSR